MDKELFERIKNTRDEFKYLYDLGVLDCNAGINGLHGVQVNTNFVLEHLGKHLTFSNSESEEFPYLVHEIVDNITFFALLSEEEYTGLKNAPSAATE